DDKTIKVTEEEGKNLEYVEPPLDANPGDTLEQQILMDSRHLLSFLDDIVQIKEDPQAFLNGVQTLQLFGPCYVMLEGGKMVIQANLEGIFMKFQYSSPHKIFGYRPSAKASIMLFSANIETEFKVNNETGKIDYLHSFTIKDFNDMQVQVKGIRPFNRVVTAAISFATKLFKNSVKSWLEAQIKNHINQLLRSLKISSQPPKETCIKSQEFNMSNEEIRVKDDEILLNTEKILVNTDETLESTDEINVNINGIRVDNEIRLKTSEARMNKGNRVISNKTRVNNIETHERNVKSKRNNKGTRVNINEIHLKTETYVQEVAPPTEDSKNIDG
ncbi:uncharacterized protein NPIL_685361, partial [Nephila pilipes]